MRIPDELTKSVCFICALIQNGPKKGSYQAYGTGFFVAVLDDDRIFIYLVTAQHIVNEARNAGHSNVHARMNKKDGTVGYVDLGAVDSWVTLKDNANDVAILPFDLDLDTFDCKLIPESMMLTAVEAKSRQVGPGDELIAVGLFTLHTGRDRNIPIARTGIISAMPSN